MPTPAVVRPMTQLEYDAWYPREVEAFARALVDAGTDPATAAEQSQQVHERALPEGLRTPGAHVLHVVDHDGATVGVLWVGPHLWEPGNGFVWNVEIDEPHRGKGLGRGAMLAAERIAAEEGWARLSLNVFGDNTAARRLYRSLGYLESSVTMDKTLDR